LRFLVASVVYIKRNREDVSNEENVSNEDANNEMSDDLNDMTSTKSKIRDLIDNGVIDRVDRGLPVPHKSFKDLQDIKEEFESYFDEDSGNSLTEGLEEVAEYLDGEIASLAGNNPSEGSNTPVEDESKRRKVEDSSENSSSSSSTDLPIEMPSIFDDVD
jgi:hypothetical protein